MQYTPILKRGAKNERGESANDVTAAIFVPLAPAVADSPTRTDVVHGVGRA